MCKSQKLKLVLWWTKFPIPCTKTCIEVDKVSHPLLLFKLVTLSTN